MKTVQIAALIYRMCANEQRDPAITARGKYKIEIGECLRIE